MQSKIKKLIILLKKKFFIRYKYTILDENEISWKSINSKIKNELQTNLNFIDLKKYKSYFDFLKQLWLVKNFSILTSLDELRLSGNHFKPLIINKNNNKIIILCHGITGNLWSLFYVIHLFLQLGYQVIAYDARNHGLSSKSKTSLGKKESSDLEDVINWTKENCHFESIGLYGFSLGASTLLFWLGSYQNQHPEVKICICEAPFDKFSENLRVLSGSENINNWKNKIVKYLINVKLQDNLHEINPFLALPSLLKVKLLLLHGVSDFTISWKSSYNIWNNFQENLTNQKNVKAYLFRKADHGEVPFIGDALPRNICWIKNKKKFPASRYETFTELLTAFLEKNF